METNIINFIYQLITLYVNFEFKLNYTTHKIYFQGIGNKF